ncbi:MAG: hypothetical protein HYZ74_02390 [Elusimicrobia bacterium]|nr:hypothetical protein [Elusimicrobiota bacterium]
MDRSSKCSTMADTVSKIVRDLTRARNEKNPDDQAEIVRDILAGAGDSGVAYENILKVLVQSVVDDPKDPTDGVAAIVEIDVKTGNKEPDIKKRFVLNKNGAGSPEIGVYSAARARFLAPTIISD